MAPLFKIGSSSFVISKDSCPYIFGWCGTFSWDGSKIKSIFRPDTHFRISGLLVSFSQCFTQYCSLSARGTWWLVHLEISFAPMGVYPLTGVMEIFLVNFHLQVVGEQFPWYRFLPYCVFLAERCSCWKKLSFCCIFLPGNILFLYPWLPPLCRW